MEFELKGVQYRTAKLSVFDQLKVTRKLLPVLAGLMSDFQSIRDGARLTAEDPQSAEKVYTLLESLLPKIADVLSGFSEEDTNAIIHTCLARVARQHGRGWSPVFSQGELMFDDIDLMSMLQMVGRVVGDSLGNFLPAAPANETQPPPAG
ncbi:phage tail assembly chaperone [Candidatus Pantoea multigeneris]|uniref:Bacteriophage protein n=1 Tax=Candidatus Pantoea multigeneris TaxID=2608357 RepID=A0ABX0RAI9_9GAMM|nr:hypothetical protein [Pantoea multigeneris]